MAKKNPIKIKQKRGSTPADVAKKLGKPHKKIADLPGPSGKDDSTSPNKNVP